MDIKRVPKGTTKQQGFNAPKSQIDVSKDSYIAKTLYGLEEVLAEELNGLGAHDIRVGKRMVSFSGDKRMLYTANYRLHTALRILKPIYTFNCQSIDELYETLLHFPWSSYMRCDQTFVIDPVVYSSYFPNSRYVSYRVKDALADYFVATDPQGKRPSVNLEKPDIYFNVHIAERTVTLSLDSSGESLHKRGYKIKQTSAPLNEVLAAGILLKAGWQGQCDLLDPMCGSGTFSIEAALMARGIAPGAWRSHFAFMSWLDFDARLWQEVQDDTFYERAFEHHIYASDVANDAYTVTATNVQHMGLGHDITVTRKAMQQLNPPQEPALIMLNPPYGERLQRYDLEKLYAMIGSELKHKYAGCNVWVIAPKNKLFHAIGLRPSYRCTLLNGDLECELRHYELFAGKRQEYKQREGMAEKERKEVSHLAFPTSNNECSARGCKRFNSEPKREKHFGNDFHRKRPSHRRSRIQVFEDKE